MDLIITTPKCEMKNAKLEAEKCIKDGGGIYFRRFSTKDYPKKVKVGDKVFYVEDGHIRGFAVINNIVNSQVNVFCSTTGKKYFPGFYIEMDAKSWQWIEPIRMDGFQRFRYVKERFEYKVVGSWLDPKPEVKETI